ncbi:DUF2742 domain-containing protein [Gordonia hongkongensis]|uniref:DUF2742 domain-containing protein n=1 Tax=Gordonia hongkongensis TaxID=1701090 RepID=UPI001FF8518E|nr:DUF2742 domain-containing protein [Gordonia hongkongensis]UPG69339.1 DUF2742 domain-containing protein [Gordonia hongkongensis]
MSYGVNWGAVRDFVCRLPARPKTTIIAGSPEWCALDDDDPAKLAALITAGSRWVLETECTEIQNRRDAEKAAAVDLAQARDWAAVAQRIRDRDTALRNGAYIARKAAS